jgi:hypothetical protein
MKRTGNPKLKIGKYETVYFDGDRLSNGHWLVPKSAVQLSDTGLQSLIDAGIRFSRNGELRTQDAADVPDMARMAAPPESRKVGSFQVSELGWLRPDDVGWVRILSQDGKLVGIAEEYFGLVRGAFEGTLDPKGPCWFRGNGDDWIVVMPIMLDGVEEDIRMLQETLSTPAEEDNQ